MKNELIFSKGHIKQWRPITGEVIVEYDIPNENVPHYFNHTGFVTPSGRKFIDATSGEYMKYSRKRVNGLLTSISRRTGSNVIEDIVLTDGSLGPAGAPDGTYTPVIDATNYSDAAYNKALTKLYDNIKLTESNLALTLGEAREASRMLQVGKSISEVLTIARRAKREFLSNPSKSLSKVWLSYQLGWKPLLNDIYNYLHWRYAAFDEGIPIRGRSNIVTKINIRTGQVKTYPGLIMTTGQSTEKAEIKVWAGIANTTAYNASRITSFNPLSLAWELLPLSFVCDWFYDIGGWLQNMESACGAGLTFKRGFVTEVVHVDWSENRIMDTIDQSGGWDYINWAKTNTHFLRAIKRRQVLSGFPFPRAPVFKAKLGSGQLITAAALLRVILLGKVR